MSVEAMMRARGQRDVAEARANKYEEALKRAHSESCPTYDDETGRCTGCWMSRVLPGMEAKP